MVKVFEGVCLKDVVYKILSRGFVEMINLVKLVRWVLCNIRMEIECGFIFWMLLRV